MKNIMQKIGLTYSFLNRKKKSNFSIIAFVKWFFRELQS